ncbi:MAG: hypothetical protein R2848_15605 [Thermomicrobiales bacterium]
MESVCVVVYDNIIASEETERIEHALAMRLFVALGQDRAKDGVVGIDGISPPGMGGRRDMPVAVDVKRRDIDQPQVSP